MNWFRKTIFSPRFWLGRNKFSATESDLSVTVVIPAWNEEDSIADTIESVLDQDYPIDLLKVIVVNDRSTDRTGEIAREYYDVKVIDVVEKAGSKSQALNYAIPFVTTNIFICVDADTFLEPDAVRKLMRAFNNPNVAVASGFVISKHDQNFWQCARRGDYIVGQSIIKSAQENANSVFVASGCFFAIRSEILKEHKFDDRTMAEDMDLTWSVIEDGYDVVFVKDAYCYVIDPDSWYLFHKQVYRWYAGMWQCIKQRRFDLFSKNPKLGIVIYFYAIWALLAAPMTVALLVFGTLWSPGLTIIIVISMYLSLLVPAYFHGVWNRFDVSRYPRNVAYMVVAGFINYGIFIEAMVNELIIGKTLKVWVKGH